MYPLEKHTFHYGKWKKFYCCELSVADFYLYIKDPAGCIKYKVEQLNKQFPQLTDRQYRRFVSILVWSEGAKLENIKSSTVEKSKQFLKDFHLYVCWTANAVNIDVMNLPLEMFWKILKDIETIVGKVKYDALRHSGLPDKTKLNEIFW